MPFWMYVVLSVRKNLDLHAFSEKNIQIFIDFIHKNFHLYLKPLKLYSNVFNEVAIQ